jgi:4-amino-4-deoxy-L-arabinose transferase-like glycosyltransferase
MASVQRPVESVGVPGPRPRWALVVLGLILAAFVVIRGPVMARQPGGLDEEYYAVPGLTIVDGGIPRMPHVPQRDPARVFYLADQALFAEPPLSFYWQALFFIVLPDTYGAARCATAVAALVVLWLTYELGRRLYGSEAAGLWAAGLCVPARSFYFAAQTARPDILCTAFGLGALLCVARWQIAEDRRWLILAGVLLGLGGLTHPLAIVVAAQAAGWVFLASHGWRRISRVGLLALLAIAVTACWLPLILQYPEAFRAQFLNNILKPAGPGLLARLVNPIDSLRTQGWMMTGHLGVMQSALLLGAPVIAVVWDRFRQRGPLIAWLLALSSVYLMAAAAGRHPTQYQWCYPTTLLCLCLGHLAHMVGALLGRLGEIGRSISWAGGLVLIGLMLPGAGLRTWLAHVRHWDDVNYDAPAFARQMLADMPPDARFTVDREFALDFLAAGRRTILAETFEMYLSAQDFEYDYLIVSRHGLDEDVAATLRGTLVRTYGEREDLFACYAEVYRPTGDGPPRGE